MIRGKNYFYAKNKFISYSKWKDNFGSFIFPAIMFDKKLPISPELKVSRLTIFLFRKRYVFDFGTVENKKPFVMEDSSIHKMIDWIRGQGKAFKNFTKQDLENIISSHPKLKELLTDNGANLFYVREMVLVLYLEKTTQKEGEFKDFNF